MVGDDQMRGAQGQAAAVEQAQFFAGARLPHHDAAAEFAEVESMQRLAEFQHHIVGDIDRDIDAARAAAAQALGEPVRRARAQIHTAHRAPGVPRAGRRRAQFDR